MAKHAKPVKHFHAKTKAIASRLDTALDAAEALLPRLFEIRAAITDADMSVATLRRTDISTGPMNSVAAAFQSHRALEAAVVDVERALHKMFDLGHQLGGLHESVVGALSAAIARAETPTTD